MDEAKQIIGGLLAVIKSPNITFDELNLIGCRNISNFVTAAEQYMAREEEDNDREAAESVISERRV